MKKEKEKTRTPEELEIERLRKELGDERVKVAALSRRCIRLGEALDAAILAEENRTENDMFNIINGNNLHRKALKAEWKRRCVHDKKVAADREKACKKNAFALCASAVIGFGALIFGYAGFIHGALAATIAGASAVAFGWALNTCVYLLGRCEK